MNFNESGHKLVKANGEKSDFPAFERSIADDGSIVYKGSVFLSHDYTSFQALPFFKTVDTMVEYTFGFELFVSCPILTLSGTTLITRSP